MQEARATPSCAGSGLIPRRCVVLALAALGGFLAAEESPKDKDRPRPALPEGRAAPGQTPPRAQAPAPGVRTFELPDPAVRPDLTRIKGVEEALRAIESAGKQKESSEGTAIAPQKTSADPATPRRPSALSAFELQLQAYSDPLVGTPVLQFGYDVFEKSGQAPTDSPVGADYILGTGDNLVVSLWGALVDEDHRVSIDREGEVRLPQVGIVALKGLSLQDAEATLKRKFNDVFKDYSLQLRLGRLREMQVHVIGRVESPGRARVTSVSTLFDALSAAGGVLKEGTLRSIAVRRGAQEPRKVDLYSYLIDGDLSVDIGLAANDVVVVPPIGPRVAITGRVLRPAIYEISGKEIALDALLAMAGGYARLADRETVQIESQSPRGLTARTENLLEKSPASILLRDGDVALVKSTNPKMENVVYVAGNVALPGRYPWTKGQRVSDVLTDEALIEAGFWIRRSNPQAAEVDTPLPEPFLDYALLRRIDPHSRQEARLAFHLGRAILEKDPKEDILLEPQDTIVVFPKSAFVSPDMVFISGAVHKQDDYRFFPGMRVRDLVRMAGGLLPEAHLETAVLTRVHADQKGARFENMPIDLAKAMAGEDTANIALERNDAISVRVVPEFRKPYRVEVSGEVRHPGMYTIIPGERLSDLLQRAGGFTKDAYLPAAQFYRESVRQLQQQRLDEALSRLELEAKAAAQKFSADARAAGDTNANVATEQERIEKLVAAIRERPAKGRMVLRVVPPERLQGNADDVELADGDKLVVPRKPEEVHVVGAVFNQTALLYEEKLTVEDYIQECGGASEQSDMDNAYVIRADGSADSAQNARSDYRWDSARGRYSQGDFLSSELYPGDTVVVPYDIRPQISTLALVTSVSQILFQAALATGVVVAIL